MMRQLIQPAKVPEWFRKARFGLFIHWGLYAVRGHGEQSLFRELLDHSAYFRLASRFRAEHYDPSRWAATARAAGMDYMVLTTKHHDGFCLWDTATTRRNAVQAGPRRDLVADYVKACRRSGLRVGLYFSLPDWSVPAFLAGSKLDPRGYRNFIRMTWRQIEELVSNYGRIDLLWFDSAATPTARELDSTALAAMIRRHQPDIIINDRLPKPPEGGGWGYATPEQEVGRDAEAGGESCITSTRKFWGYHVCHKDPSQWRSERELVEMLAACLCRGGKLLLNVGPRASGEFPALFSRRAAVLGRWLKANRQAVDGATLMDFPFEYGGLMTRKAARIYLCWFYWPGREYSLPGFSGKLRSARLLGGGKRIRFIQEPHRIILRGLPQKEPGFCPVLELVFDGVPRPHSWTKYRLHAFPMPGLVPWARR